MQPQVQTLPRVGVRIIASGKLGLLPPPLAGEGWGGGEHVR
jgi:hypothetical protein